MTAPRMVGDIQSERGRGILFWASVAISLPVMFVLLQLNGLLTNSTAKEGVISFEQARTLARQSDVLASWGTSERTALALSTGLAFLFIFAATAMLVMACFWLGDRAPALLSKLGRAVAHVMWMMSVFWLLQTILMSAALFGAASETTAEITYWCSLLKSVVLAAAFGYVVLAGSVVGVLRLRGR